MSKLYKKYLELKSINTEQLYLFKAGIFYIFLDTDAKIVSEKIDLKLTKLNDTISKCGFPVSNLGKYINLLNENNFKFIIVDEALNTVSSTSDYLANAEIVNFLNKIKDLNIDKVSPLQAFDMLYNLKSILQGVNINETR